MSRRWNVKSVMETVVKRRGIYVMFGKAKRSNAIHKALLKRIKSATCVGDELEIYSKVAQGMSRKDHVISVCCDNDCVRLFDNAHPRLALN